MASEGQSTEYELLKTGLSVGFRIVSEEVLSAPDEAEFGMRLELKFVAEDDDDEQHEDDVAEETAEWGSLGFLFVLGALSFVDAKPRNLSVADYSEKDNFGLADFVKGMGFKRGELHFDADYIRGRRIKTRVAVRTNGTVRLETIGRGKAALRWLEQMKGKHFLRVVGNDLRPSPRRDLPVVTSRMNGSPRREPIRVSTEIRS